MNSDNEPMYLISESELDACGGALPVEEEQAIRARGPVQQAPAISRHLGTIRASSDAMKYLSDEEIITRCLSMMAGMFSAQNDRRKEPGVFFNE